MTLRLILLRHGQTEFNRARRMQGHIDTELSDLGWQQAAAAADYLERYHIEQIIASDLQRAFATATVVGQRLGIEVRADERLRETHLGDWQGKTHAEIDESHPGARARWRYDATWAPPNAETRQEVAVRAHEVVDELIEQPHEDATVLLVSHGGTISALTASLLGFAQSRHPIFASLGNTCWSQLLGRQKLDAPGYQWYLEGWNVGSVLNPR